VQNADYIVVTLDAIFYFKTVLIDAELRDFRCRITWL